jgi:hypothetical protein
MDDDNKLVKALRWVMDIDPASVITDVTKKRSALGGDDGAREQARRLAERFVESHARMAGVEGFALGIASNPLLIFGTALGDVAFVLRFYAYLTAAIGYLANPNYFDDPDWKNDALLILAGPKAVSRLMREAGIQFGKHGSKVLLKKYLRKGVLAALKKFILRWFGKKVTQRMIITKLVAIAGGVVGGAWNYVELRAVGNRIIAYHFDDRLD